MVTRNQRSTGQSDPGLPQQIGERYRVLTQLGRGGMAVVYRVRDLASERDVALKQLRFDPTDVRAAEMRALFEREFYTLAQLSHPRVIEVYDYGVCDQRPYYTMELLTGADLRTLAPLPWQRACELMYDVASSLALVHSRRLVHRDISPNNIRCTGDGGAKLIDFGAMVPMGTQPTAVGTPAFVAPEVVQRSALDARTDLFSLGATLQFAITGKPALQVSGFEQLRSAWATPRVAPSLSCSGIPAELDALVLELTSLDPNARPRSAFEVMQRLAALVGRRPIEPKQVGQGYLTTPKLVGREQELRRLRWHLREALRGRGQAVLIEGQAGLGRSRLLDVCALEAKTLGLCVLRVGASDHAGEPFAAAQALLAQLMDAMPQRAQRALQTTGDAALLLNGAVPGAAGRVRLLPLSAASGEPAALQNALSRWLLVLSASAPIAIVADDVQRLDAATTALLAALARAVRGSRLAIVASVEAAAAHPATTALDVLARYCVKLQLTALDRRDTEALFRGVFGAVPNVPMLSDRIYAAAAGNPRKSLALAQHLLERGTLTYAGGSWSLPERLAVDELSTSVEQVFAERIARLSELARVLAEAHALSLFSAMTRDDYRSLAGDADPLEVDAALVELRYHEMLVGDGRTYALAHRGFAAALRAQLTMAARARHHAALARLAQRHKAPLAAVAYHLLAAGQRDAALDQLAALDDYWMHRLQDLDPVQVAGMLETALQASIDAGRPERETCELRRRLTGVSLLADERIYTRVAPAWLAQLERDCGLVDYRALSGVDDRAQRLRLALERCAARYAQTPESERVYAPQEALTLLAFYVVLSIAIGVRLLDVALLRGLPALVEPLSSLSPLLDAIWQNSLATCEAVFRGQPERASGRWLGVYERLSTIPDDPRVRAVRYSVAYALGDDLAVLGLRSALPWIELLQQDPLQRVNAEYLSRVVCLQYGDWAGAERHREQAELQAVQASTRQLFDAPLRSELMAHWLGRNIAGVKQIGDRLQRLLQTRPGYRAHYELARGYFEALRGDHGAALAAFERCLHLFEPDPDRADRCLDAYCRASAGRVAMLTELGREVEARACGERALARCAALEIEVLAQPIHCDLALAEARCGDIARASERIERVLRDQTARGVTGLQLGASYEARARVAIAARSERDALHYCELVAREYRYGAGSVLAGRYGRLVQDALRAGVKVPARLSNFESAVLTPAAHGAWAQLAGDLLHGQAEPERARRALHRLCEQGKVEAGHLYLARGHQLQWVASLGPAAASEALTRFARAHFDGVLEEDAMSTVLTELSRWQRPAPGAIWQDGSERFQIVVLRTGSPLQPHAGLVALTLAAGQSVVVLEPALVQSLALQLLPAAMHTPKGD